MTTVVVNGNTYTDDNNPDHGMAEGGHRKNLLPMLSDTMIDINSKQASAAASQTSAAASAASAILSPGTSATSTTSTAIANNVDKNITIQTGKSLVPGMSVKMASTANPDIWMFGDVLSYVSGTGDLWTRITKVQGSGTFADWTVSLSGPLGPDYGGAVTSNTETGTAVSLSPGNGRYAAIVNGQTGRRVQVPAWAATLNGPGTFTVANISEAQKVNGTTAGLGGQDLRFTGDSSPFPLLGYLPADQSTDINFGATGSTPYSDRSFSNLRPYGTEVMAQLDLASIVAGTSGTYVRAIDIDVNLVLLLIHGASLHAVVYSKTLGIFGTPVQIRATLSTAGAENNVMVRPDRSTTPGRFVVASVPDGGTALQIQPLIVDISTRTISLGSLNSVTLAAAATRLVDFIDVTLGSGSASTTSMVLGYLSGTTILRTLAISLASGSTAVSVGAELLHPTTTGSFAVLLALPTSENFATLTSNGTTLTCRVTAVSGGTTQTAGNSATAAHTSMAHLHVRDTGFADPALFAVTVLDTTLKVLRLSISGTTPTFSAASAIQAQVATLNTAAVGALLGTEVFTAVSGTDSGGRFITEFFRTDILTTAAAAVATPAVVAMPAAHSVVFLGWSPRSPASSLMSLWQLATATDVTVVATNKAGFAPTLSAWPMPGLAPTVHLFASPDPVVNPKYWWAKTYMRTSNDAPGTWRQNALSVVDNSKPGLVASLSGMHLKPTAGPVMVINSLANAGRQLKNLGTSVDASSREVALDAVWLVSSFTPSLRVLIQRFTV